MAQKATPSLYTLPQRASKHLHGSDKTKIVNGRVGRGKTGIVLPLFCIMVQVSVRTLASAWQEMRIL